jgi:hypothetical protein
MQEDCIEQYALELLQAIREHHPHIYAGAWVDPYTAALEAGLNPGSPTYRGAMNICKSRVYWRGRRKPASWWESRSTPSPSGAWKCCERCDGQHPT